MLFMNEILLFTESTSDHIAINGNSVISANSGNLLNHWSINSGQFKYPVSHLCLAGTVVASWSLAQEVPGSNTFVLMTNILIYWIQWIQWIV